jgi:hypothetical protein
LFGKQSLILFQIDIHLFSLRINFTLFFLLFFSFCFGGHQADDFDQIGRNDGQSSVIFGFNGDTTFQSYGKKINSNGLLVHDQTIRFVAVTTRPGKYHTIA